MASMGPHGSSSTPPKSVSQPPAPPASTDSCANERATPASHASRKACSVADKPSTSVAQEDRRRWVKRNRGLALARDERACGEA